MKLHALGEWIQAAGGAIQTGWSQSALSRLASMEIPPVVLGDLGWAVRGDAATTWARWFLESFVDSASYISNERLTLADFYEAIVEVVDAEYDDMPQDERREVAKKLSFVVWQEIEFLRRVKRDRLSKRHREHLWYANEPDPRCYLCGYRFSQEAKMAFLGQGRREDIPKPRLLDFVRPRGRYEADLSVAVDHVRPVARGGETVDDNLALACGWCNRAKSSYMQFYESSGSFRDKIRHPRLGWVSIPRPLWVVRCIQLRGRCEDPSGCGARLTDSELFIAPKRMHGALTPSNCGVFCRDHDPWRGVRFVGENILPSRTRRS